MCTIPYAAEPIIIVRIGDAVAGTPAGNADASRQRRRQPATLAPIGNAHTSRPALTFPDLDGPFLQREI